MPEEQLGINITARDSASAQVERLRAQIIGLKEALASVGRDTGMAVALQSQVSALQSRIVALGGSVKTQQEIMAQMSASVTQRNNEALASIEKLAAAERAAAMYVPRLAQAPGSTLRVAPLMNTAEIIAQNTGLNQQALSYSELIAMRNREATSAAAAGRAELDAAAAMDKAALAAQGEVRSLAELVEAQLGVGKSAGISEAEVNAAFGGEAAGMAAGGGAINRESRHIVGLFDSLARGQRGQAISTIGAAMRDAGLGATALTSSIGGMAAIMGSVALVRGVENMGKWAQNARDAAAATGMTVNEFTRLQASLEMVGLKGDSADAALRQFAKNVSQAIADPSSKAATALGNLGIKQTDLVKSGGDAYSVLLMLSQAMQTDSGQTNIAANIHALFGINVDKVIALLMRSKAELLAMGDAAEKNGSTLNDNTAPAIANTAEKLNQLDNSISGHAKLAMEAWIPEINLTLDALTALGIGIATVIQKLGDLANGPFTGVLLKALFGALPGSNVLQLISEIKEMITVANSGKSVSVSLPPAQTNAVPPLGGGSAATTMQQVDDEITKAREAASMATTNVKQLAVAELQAEVNTLTKIKAERQLSVEDQTRLDIELARANTELHDTQLRNAASAAKGEVTAAQSLRDFMLGMYAAIRRASEKAAKQQLADLKNLKQETQDINTTQTSLTKLGLMGSSSTNSADFAGSLATQAKRIMESGQYWVQYYQSIEENASASAETQKQAATEVLATIKDTSDQVQGLFDKSDAASRKSAEEARKSWDDFFNHLVSSAQSYTNSVLAALVSPGFKYIYQQGTVIPIKVSLQGQELENAARKLFQSIGNDVVDSVEKMLTMLAVSGLAKVFSVNMEGSSGLGGLMSGLLQKIPGVGGMFGGVSGGAQSAGNFGATAANLNLFNQALTRATATLTGHSAATTTDTTSTTASTGATTVNTGTTAVNTTATATDAATTGTNSASTAVNTLATQVNTTASDTNTLSLLKSAADAAIAGVEFLLAGLKSLAFEGGGIVPSAAGGMVVGGLGSGATFAVLHAQEMVLPKYLSQGLQSMISAGGAERGNATGAGLAIGSINAIDSKSFLNFINNPINMRNLAARISQFITINPSLRPQY